ncbi:MAG TPA: rhodanese-like domain-containing protein [Terriglobia bacterium]
MPRVEKHKTPARLRASLAISLALPAVVAALVLSKTTFARPSPLAEPPSASADSPEPWSASEVVKPEALARELAGTSASKPLVVCVGFSFFYESAHVPGSLVQGPAREASGLKSLEAAAQAWPRDRSVVVYCGCCPFKQCPNIRPAFEALKRMGFTHLRVLDLERDFHTDWLQKGLPVEKSPPAPEK